MSTQATPAQVQEARELQANFKYSAAVALLYKLGLLANKKPTKVVAVDTLNNFCTEHEGYVDWGFDAALVYPEGAEGKLFYDEETCFYSLVDGMAVDLACLLEGMAVELASSLEESPKVEVEEVQYVDAVGNPIKLEGDKYVVYSRKHGNKIKEMTLEHYERVLPHLHTEEDWQSTQKARNEGLVKKSEKSAPKEVKVRPVNTAAKSKKVYVLPPAAAVKACKPGSIMDTIVKLLDVGSRLEDFEAYGIGTGRNGLSHFAPYINKHKGYGVKQIGDRFWLWLPGQAEPTENPMPLTA